MALIGSDAELVTAEQLGLIWPRLPPGEAARRGGPPASLVANQDAVAETLHELERGEGQQDGRGDRAGITRMRLYTKLKRLGLPSQ